MQAIDQMQVRDSLRMYNSLVEKCFNECVQGFRSKDLDTGEERCVQNCCNKFIKGSARVGQRFGELSAEVGTGLLPDHPHALTLSLIHNSLCIRFTGRAADAADDAAEINLVAIHPRGDRPLIASYASKT